MLKEFLKPVLSYWGKIVLGIAVLLPLFFSTNSLQKGQVIKQFFAYSITDSLSKAPLDILGTTVPCHDGPKPWVEEPPLFHFLAAGGELLVPGYAALIPWVAFVLLAWAVFLILSQQKAIPLQFRYLGTAVVIMSPVFVRYSIQHLPDLLATGFLTLGAVRLSKTYKAQAVLLFILATTTKILTVFGLVPILIWFYLRKKVSFSFILICILSTCLPFLGWLALIYFHKIPSPFLFLNGIENRHSGSLELLVSAGFYLRAFTWLAIKGVGVFLFFPAGVKTVSILKGMKKFSNTKPGTLNKTSSGIAPIEEMLVFWSLGLIPYWLMVRQGNFVHDYYSLVFAPPLAILGVCQLYRWQIQNELFTRISAALVLLSLANGAYHLASLRKISIPEGQKRPIYCESEIH